MADGWMVAWWLGGGASIGALGMYLRMEVLMRQERGRHVERLLDMQLDTQTAMIAAARKGQERAVEAVVDDPMANLTSEMLTRLLDAALPKRDPDVSRDDERPGSPGEYEAPDREVSDWTDPFFGLERQLVGGLRPGEGIPGIGQQEDIGGEFVAPDEWESPGVEAYADHPLANGFLPDDDAAREGWRDLGGEVFEEWDSRG